MERIGCTTAITVFLLDDSFESLTLERILLDTNNFLSTFSFLFNHGYVEILKIKDLGTIEGHLDCTNSQ